MPLPAGTRLGRYVIVAPLGAGGMGEVYRARDTHLGRDVAVKVLPEHLAGDPDALARFQAEARAVAALEHPNILVLHDVGTESGCCFAVMELLEGETLKDRLDRAPLPWRKAVELGVALAEGLGAAHARGVVHRDLKPGNVFLTAAGQLKILDFGLASRASSASALDTRPYTVVPTGPVTVYGTVPYMAPEQVRGQPADARSDIFSLGCVLYEMVTARPAFARRTRPEIQAAILHDDPPPLGGPAGAVPPELERVIRHCLEKNAEERFQSARDVAFALRALLGDTPTSQTFPAVPGRRPARPGWGAAILLLAAAGAAALYFFLKPAPEPAPAADADTVAVLPFVNVGGAADTEYLSDGMADSLARNLSQIRRLKVRPFSSALRYKGKQAELAAAGRGLQVRLLVAGRVMKRGDELSVSVELVDVQDHRLLWGRQFHHPFGNLILLQEEIAREIADNLPVTLTGKEKRQLTRHDTENAEAYRLYLLGRFAWNQRTREGLGRAIEYFQQAIGRDPHFALAYAGLADCYNLFAGYGYGQLTPREAFRRARAMARRALRIDDSLAEAHTALAFVKATDDWDWPGAEREYQAALRCNPNYSTGRHWHACYLADLGRHAEALAEIRRARDLDPSSLIINGWLALILGYGGRTGEALRQAQATVRMDPGFAVGHFFLGTVYEMRGEYRQAARAFAKAVELERDSVTYLTALGSAEALAGRHDEARRILAELTARAKNRYVSPYGIASIYAGLGDKDAAFRWLERAFAERDAGLGNLQIDPNWEPLRSDRRFQELVRRMKFPH
jgi:serine/threonine-protein kinase